MASASAGPALDRVKAAGVIRCGAAARPGLLEQDAAGKASGLFVDLCRAIGVAAAGPAVAARMTVYDSDKTFDEARTGRDDVFFVSGGEIAEGKLAGVVTPGPPAFFATVALMAQGGAPARRPADFAGRPICFLQGGVAHRALEAWFAARRLPFVRMAYQEEDEMYDAFDAGQCDALAGEATTLAAVRREGGKNRRNGRILAEPLATFPILLATSPRDGEWSALAAWALAALIDADRPRRDWAAGGLDSLPIEASALGFAASWRQTMVAATGGYAEMLRRNVGEASPLRLPAGPNALVDQGGLMAPPYAE